MQALSTFKLTQEVINEMDSEPLIKLNWQSFRIEFTKFLAFGHSLQEEETIKSITKDG